MSYLNYRTSKHTTEVLIFTKIKIDKVTKMRYTYLHTGLILEQFDCFYSFCMVTFYVLDWEKGLC